MSRLKMNKPLFSPIIRSESERNVVIRVSIGIFFAALVPRLLLWETARHSVFFEFPILDAHYYETWARNILSGESLAGNAYFMSPAYPYLLAAIFKLFGNTISMATLIQCVIGSFSCVLVFLIARQILPLRTSALAGLLLAVCGTSVFYSSLLLKATWIEFFNVCLVLLMFKAVADPQLKWWWLCGLILGLSIHFRPNVLVMLPMIIILALVHGRGISKSSLLRIFSVCLGLLFSLFPVMLRNRLIGGEWVMSTTNGGMNFYTGNNPIFAAPYRSPPFARSDPTYEEEDFYREAVRRAGRNLTREEASQFWFQEAFRWIKQEPTAWAALIAKKFQLLWNDYEQPVNQNIYFYAEHFAILNALKWIGYGVLAPLALLSIGLTIRSWQLLPLHLYVLAYIAVLTGFFISSEHRHPLTFCLAIYAAYAVEWTIRQVGSANKSAPKRLIAAFCAVGIFFLFVRHPTKRALGYELDLAVSYSNIAETIYGASHTDKALRYFERALSLKPDLPEAHNNLGILMMDLKRPNEAISHYSAALKARPAYAEAHNNMGIALANRGLNDEAARHYLQALKIRGSYPEPMVNLANILLGEGKIEAAIEYYQRALEISPDFADAHNNIGTAFFRQERFADAAWHYREAIRIRPNLAQAHCNLANTLTRQGKEEEAVTHYQEALRLSPDYQRAEQGLRHALARIHDRSEGINR